MPRFAPVAPLHGLQKLYAEGQLGNYQLLIAPKVLEQNWAYGRFFYEHFDQFVVLDNGVIELGYPLAPDELAKAAKTVNAAVVVMPDSIDDGRYTVKLTRKALTAYRKLDPGRLAMGVVQGTTWEECLECAKALVDSDVDWLAVPRGLTVNLKTRVPLVQHLGDEYGLPIHVLGFSDNLRDDLEAAASHRLVMGLDAATPVWTRETLPEAPPSDLEYSRSLGRRPTGFWLDDVSPVAATNVRTVRQWLTDASAVRISREGLAGQTDPLTHGYWSSERLRVKKSSEPTDPS